MSENDVGIIGLGVMGRNLALNMERNGFLVSGFDVDAESRRTASQTFAGAGIEVYSGPEELVRSLSHPRKILMMVPAGKAVDAVIAELKPLLSPDDILIDGGNSFFQDSERRARELEPLEILFLGMGVSGGQEGALLGPSLMPGGRPEAYEPAAPILTRIAAQVADGPCCAYMGRGGAGHYVKMVHNGIEYGIMQLICEVYDLLQSSLGMTAPQLAEVFSSWNEGQLNSFLIEATAIVLGVLDEETNEPLVDRILDQAGQKGTGKWTSQNAMDLGVPTPTLNAAVEARIHSAYKDERVAASRVLRGPEKSKFKPEDDLIETAREGLRLAILTCYAQGFALLREASREYEFGLEHSEIARIWKGGCIIRARVLEDIQGAFREQPDLNNLLVHDSFAKLANSSHSVLRKLVVQAVQSGVPSLCLGASLGYLDSLRRERLPANLLQAQRDFFGAHTYRRIDREGVFHTDWKSSHREKR